MTTFYPDAKQIAKGVSDIKGHRINREKLMHEARERWAQMTVLEHTKHIVQNRDYIPGLDDEVLFERIDSLERP